jgi:putative phosphoesterase
MIMRIAVLADIHGNVIALEAVLADLARHKPDLTVDLGDCASGPLWPRETMERLADLRAVTVRGNHDRQVSTLTSEEMGSSDRFAHDQLKSHQREVLKGLPMSLQIAPGILAFHASPHQDDLYLLDEVVDGRLVRASPKTVAERLGNMDAKIILCGHSHRPDMLHLDSDVLIINPGSVGCPAYDDPSHPAHVSESGTPHARYALVDIQANGQATVKMIAVTYDHEAAAARAQANGRPEWAYALKTGLMPSLL